MYELQNLLPPFVLIILPLILILVFTKISKTSKSNPRSRSNTELPKPYPIVGHLPAFSGLSGQQIFEWLSKIIACSPSATVVIHLPFGKQNIYTGNPANVEHILKTQQPIYQKGRHTKTVFRDLFGDGVFTEDGDTWKSRRQVLALAFTHKALQKFVENEVRFEVSERLLPVIRDAVEGNKVIDLQDVFQRFAFDNVCTLAFGYDPGYLTLPFPEAKFTEAFDECLSVCHARFHALIPIIWKTCRLLNIGSEKKLKDQVRMIREFVKSLVLSVKNKSITQEINDKESNLSIKLLECKQFDDEIVIDLVVGFILAGRDTTSAALTWFFWLLHKNKHVEEEIIKEVRKYEEKVRNGKSNSNSKASLALEALKEMTYTHAALSETMRLYPPVPADLKQVACDDVLPDGTRVKKGSIVGYFTQAMGWSEKIWGPDWSEFRPERWLREDLDPVTREKKWIFVPVDAYSYPVFLGGPRICPGKEMGYLQMKSVAAAILSRYRVVPVMADGFEPVYFISTVAVMEGGFPVRIEERV